MLRVIRDGTNKRLRRPGRLTPSLFPISQRRQINLYKGRKFFLRQSRSRAQHFNRLRVDLGYSGRLTSPQAYSLQNESIRLDPHEFEDGGVFEGAAGMDAFARENTATMEAIRATSPLRP